MSEQRGDYLSDQSIDRLGGYRDLLRDLERGAVQDDYYGSAYKELTFEAQVWDILDSAGDLLLKKHQRYGPRNISDAPGGPENGLRVRMWDKMARLNHLLDNPEVDPDDESLTDTLLDLLNYCAIFIMVRNNQWPMPGRTTR